VPDMSLTDIRRPLDGTVYMGLPPPHLTSSLERPGWDGLMSIPHEIIVETTVVPNASLGKLPECGRPVICAAAITELAFLVLMKRPRHARHTRAKAALTGL
jgi:hypothetical protein